MKSLTIFKLISSGFGSGFTHWAPGTAGSCAATATWILAIHLFPLSARYLAGIFLVITVIAGILATDAVLRQETSKDPSWIVIDEWAGIFTVFAIAPQTSILYILVGFALFRVFDIIKAGPVGWAEKLPGAWGVMADDVVAGAIAGGILWSL